MTTASILPTAVHSSLAAAGLNHRPILLSIDTDIQLDGTPAQLWLVVTPDHLSVIEQSVSQQSVSQQGGVQSAVPGAGQQPMERVIAWAEIEKFRTTAGTGSGLLQVKLGEGWVDLLRFSNRLAGRFHKVSRRLEQWLEASQISSEVVSANKLSHEEESAAVALRHRFDVEHHKLSIEAMVDDDWQQELEPPRCASCQLRLTTVHESCPRCLQKGQILRRVSELMRPHMRGAIFLTVLTIVGVGAELIPPKLQQYMVDHILGSGAVPAGQASFTTALLIVVLALAASRVILSVVGWIKGRVATVIGTGLTSTLREQMVRKLQNIAVVYYDRHQVGSTLSRVAHDSEVLHGMPPDHREFLLQCSILDRLCTPLCDAVVNPSTERAQAEPSQVHARDGSGGAARTGGRYPTRREAAKNEPSKLRK